MLIFLLFLVGVNSNTITINPGYYSIETYTCSDNYLEINLQYSSSNANVNFYTTDSCSPNSYYPQLSTGSLSYYSGTLSGATNRNVVCFGFYNSNTLLPTTVTYTLNVTCGSSARNWGIFLFIVLPVVLGLICCCVCIRYFYKRANSQPTFVRVEQQHQIVPLQVITPIPSATVIKVDH